MQYPGILPNAEYPSPLHDYLFKPHLTQREMARQQSLDSERPIMTNSVGLPFPAPISSPYALLGGGNFFKEKRHPNTSILEPKLEAIFHHQRKPIARRL